MKLRDLIRLPKTITDEGSWKAGPIAAGAFRLSKAARRSYCLGPKYQWRVVQFEANGHKFRLLVAYRLDIEQYRAWLGMESGNDLKLLARYEFHGTHPGWHCHAICDDSDSIGAGTVKHGIEHRLPDGESRRKTFGITEANALAKAANFFGLDRRSNGTLV